MDKWQPIGTAPKDGSFVILTDGENTQQASWWVIEWMINIGNNPCCHLSWDNVCHAPTHWMPLPNPPEATNEN